MISLRAQVTACSIRTRARRILLQDPASKSVSATILNIDGERYDKVTYDNCVVCNQLAADLLLLRRSTGDVLIVELKGGNVEHAIKQVTSTHVFVSSRENQETFGKGDRGALIMCSQYPHGTHAQVLRSKFLARYGIVIHVNTRKREFTFDDLLTTKKSQAPVGGRKSKTKLA